MTQQPSKYATAYRLKRTPHQAWNEDTATEYGEVIRITPKYIWVDRSKQAGQTWIDKYKRIGVGFFRTMDGHKIGFRMVFKPDPLVEFISNGKQK